MRSGNDGSSSSPVHLMTQTVGSPLPTQYVPSRPGRALATPRIAEWQEIVE
jgi:hypothetical protein